ncbi:hypothetical protein [Paractinoplanes abujensis]|uniref:Uncharacterized protein n=1 Tax=Paractinoplanes abujensis TaxID=882441 RepID=A0A7W7CR56_9ACTN|nr:hypothetical protein [Actinoplanes abujensis]MBB4693177.1 hypothetical protein [Actinoplanes abujensis]
MSVEVLHPEGLLRQTGYLTGPAMAAKTVGSAAFRSSNGAHTSTGTS